jgi:soluble lytic murein transglycosylase-like protein
MPVGLFKARQKFLALLSLLALQAGLAAGSIQAGAEIDPSPRPATVAAASSVAAPHPGPGAQASAPAAHATPPASPAAALVPADRLYLQPVLEQAAQEYGLPADVVLAQAWAESSWRVDAVSRVGAAGILQLMPATVEFVSKRLLHLDHELDARDPAANARMGARFMRHLLDRTDGDLRQALIAYNQGLRALRRDGPYPAAVSYADHVIELRPVFTAGA